MSKQKIITTCFFILLFTTAFLWFQDGFFQPINPDTFLEPGSVSQELRFPEMLTARRIHHSRWFAMVLPYLSFNTITPGYYMLTGDRATGLFVAQGFYTAVSYLAFILLSAYYISQCSSLFSSRYIFSYLIVLSFTASVQYPVHLPYSPFNFRFFHASDMVHYLWSFDIILLVFLPYWKRFLYPHAAGLMQNNVVWVLWCLMALCCAFSSSCSTIISGFLAACLLFASWINNWRDNYHKEIAHPLVRKVFQNIPSFKDRYSLGLYFLFFFCSAAIFFESSGGFSEDTTNIFSKGNPLYNLREYCYIWREFLFHGAYQVAFAVALFFFILTLLINFFFSNQAFKIFNRQIILSSIFFVCTALIYSFVIGIESIPYRYRGTNLGGDTLFYLTWSLMFLIVSGIISITERPSFRILIPFVIIISVSHIFPFFSNFPMYHNQQKQRKAFNMIQELNALGAKSPILVPQSDSDVLNTWNIGLNRLPDFAASTRLTDTRCNFQLVSDSEFLSYFGKIKSNLPGQFSICK